MKPDALDWARSAGEADRVMRELEDYLRRRRRRRRRAGAAMLALLLVAGTGWLFRRSGFSPAAEPTAANAVVLRPETRALPDGSTMELKPGAMVTAAFSGEFRRVQLQQGEVFFHVAKNPLRPFVVQAAGVEVRAVGTAFSVQLGNQAVAVLVTEGRVAVNSPAATGLPVSARNLAFVDAGSRVMVGLGPYPAVLPASATPLSPEELANQLAWRIPRLEFAGTPLADAIPMFNRYCRTRLVLGDASLGRLQLSGVLRADNTDSVLRLLEVEFGIIAQTRGDEIVLRRP